MTYNINGSLYVLLPLVFCIGFLHRTSIVLVSFQLWSMVGSQRWCLNLNEEQPILGGKSRASFRTFLACQYEFDPQ
jgi:hypothetical protein